MMNYCCLLSCFIAMIQEKQAQEQHRLSSLVSLCALKWARTEMAMLSIRHHHIVSRLPWPRSTPEDALDVKLIVPSSGPVIFQKLFFGEKFAVSCLAPICELCQRTSFEVRRPRWRHFTCLNCHFMCS